MSAVQWSTLICDDEGRVDQAKLRGLTAIALGWLGGLALTAAMVGLLHPSEYVTLGASALVIPITAGKIIDGVKGLVGGAQ